MELKTIRMSIEAGIAIVTINHPPVNVITPQVIDDLETVFTALEENTELRCVVLTSALEKIFVAGADINQFVLWKKADGIRTTRRGHDVFLKIAELHKPVICAVNGIAFGGGLELALACDIRVIDKKAKIGLPETSLGVIPGYGGTQRLTKLIGAGRAKRMILTGATLTAEEACSMGVAEVLTAGGSCLDEALKLAGQIASCSPMAVTAAKKSIDYAVEHDLEDGISQEINAVGELADTEDKTEGANAFLEKRPPVFHNR